MGNNLSSYVATLHNLKQAALLFMLIKWACRHLQLLIRRMLERSGTLVAIGEGVHFQDLRLNRQAI